MIAVEMNGVTVAWSDLWPRYIAYGECEAWCGGGLVVCLTRPFTTDEDLLFDWVLKQDRCELFGIYHMEDGRDLIVFDRMFTKQSKHEAMDEHRAHVKRVLQQAGMTALAFG